MKTYGWGIIGLGGIAHRFMNDLPRCPQARLAAVASRSADKAAAFAERYGFAKSYGSYDEILNDPNVDILYIATPHALHSELAIKGLNAGKAVLCEKAVTVNSGEIRSVIEAARRSGQFFMEGMWTRFFPVSRQIHERISAGEFGRVTLAEVDFGFGRWQSGKVDNPSSRLFAADMAGGALLDVGCYCVSYATWMKGSQPVSVGALTTIVETGVDGMTNAILQFDDETMAVVRASIVQNTRQRALIYCDEATIEVPDFWHPSRAVIHYQTSGRADELIEIPYDQDGAAGFKYEAQMVMDCLDQGLVECPLMPWADSAGVMATLDKIRSEIGLKYPFEV